MRKPATRPARVPRLSRASTLLRCGDRSNAAPRRACPLVPRARVRERAWERKVMPVLVESTSPPAGKPPGTTALKFEVYRDGARERDDKPTAATAMGPESVPLPGEVAFRDGLLVLDRGDPHAAAVSLLWDVG